MTDEPKKPRKKLSTSRKVKKETKQEPRHGELTEKETEYLAGLIQSGIETARVRRMFQTSDKEKLNKMIQEFLDCYIVIGYNFQGEPVNLLSVESQQQADSLGTALTRFMSGLPRGPMNPFDSPDEY